MLKGIFLSSYLCLFFVAQNCFAIDGLNIGELPIGGDVTIPGNYPVYLPQKMEVILTGMNSPQAMTLNSTTLQKSSTIQIFSQLEKKVRAITVKPGAIVIYNFRNKKPVRLRVIDGNIKLFSAQPLKVQR